MDEWSTAAAALAARPVSGAGLEGYRVVFGSVVDIEYVQKYGRSTITDRAHSGPLDLGVAMGLPGLIAWVAAAAWVARRTWQTADSSDPVGTGLALGAVALFAQELFLFPTIEVGVLGWAVAGSIRSAPRARTFRLDSRSVAAAVGVAFALVATLCTLSVLANSAAADGAEGSLERAQLAADLRPDSYLYKLLVANTALTGQRLPAARLAVDEAIRISPADPGVRMADARLLRVEVAGGSDPQAAIQRLADLVAPDPNHPELRLIHGDLLARGGDPARAERAWLAAEQLSPSDPAPALRLASLYFAVDQPDAAMGAIERARAIDPDNPQIDELIQILDGE